MTSMSLILTLHCPRTDRHRRRGLDHSFSAYGGNITEAQQLDDPGSPALLHAGNVRPRVIEPHGRATPRLRTAGAILWHDLGATRSGPWQTRPVDGLALRSLPVGPSLPLADGRTPMKMMGGRQDPSPGDLLEARSGRSGIPTACPSPPRPRQRRRHSYCGRERRGAELVRARTLYADTQRLGRALFGRCMNIPTVSCRVSKAPGPMPPAPPRG